MPCYNSKYCTCSCLIYGTILVLRKLVAPGDLRSYGGGHGLPRPVKQSPDVSQIMEEDEPTNDVSTLLVN